MNSGVSKRRKQYRPRVAVALALFTFALTSSWSGGATVSPDSGSGSPSIKAGFAERDISPTIGMEIPGGYTKEFHKSFHDPCKVRVALFDDGKQQVVLIGVDALMLSRDVVLQSRKRILDAYGIKPEAVMIGASHSHSSGPTGMVQPHQYDGAPKDIQNLAYKESSMADQEYLRKITEEIVRGVGEAEAACVPAQLGFGSGTEAGVSFNRRFLMKSGATWTHPGAMNPDIVKPAGPIDPQVGVIGAWDLHGKLLGTVVNFACHATTNPGGISANWPYYLERTIQGAMHSDAPVVFLQGACGDITQVDNLNPYRRPGAEEWAQLVGASVGAEAVKVLVGIARTQDARLAVRQKVWPINRRVPSAEHVAQARTIVEKGKPQGDVTIWKYAKEILLENYLSSADPAVEVEVQAIQIGPAVFVSNPAELFVDYGLEIKRASGFPFTFVVELADGCVGYVPTQEAFGPHGGGYETRLTSYSNLEITAGQQFTSTGIALISEMTPDARPEPPKLRGQVPWPAGDVPPQVN
jgi:neutral ceramidase